MAPSVLRAGSGPQDVVGACQRGLFVENLPLGLRERDKYLPGECGPVCAGEIPCHVREVKRNRSHSMPH